MQAKATQTLDSSSSLVPCLLNLARSSCFRSSSQAKPPASPQNWCCLEVSSCWLQDLLSLCCAWSDRRASQPCCCASRTRPRRFAFVEPLCCWSPSLCWPHTSDSKPFLEHL